MVIRDVRVFDGERVIPRATVVVRDGSIVSVGRSAGVPRGARVVDGRGQTLLPGLIDAHVHTFAPEMLEQALVFGVTTVLDMHTDPNFVRGLREQAPGELRNLADIRAAGFAATAPGGHGTQYGMQVPTLTSPQEASAFVEARVAEGADYLKIIHEPGTAYGIQRPALDSATVAALIQAAHERGLRAVVHVSTEAAARMAIASGADGLVHIFAHEPPSPDFGRFAARHGVFVIPTLTVLESASGVPSGASLIEDERLAPLLLEATRRNLRQAFGGQRPTFPNAQAAVRQLHEAGVPIVAGSDAPNPGTTHGASVHRELELLVAAGLSPTEALAAATSRAAAAFGLEDRGRIAPGRRADLLLVRADPTADIRATRDIATVWKHGYELDREPFRARVVREHEVAQQRRAAPPPPGSEAGLVSDFGNGELTAAFGSGWIASTDQMMGGRSTAELRVTEGGAEGSTHSLSITGEVAPGLPFAWAGAAFLPGEQPMQPANLSGWREIVFQARGDGRTYRLMLFAESLGMAPATRPFVAGPDWREYHFPIASFQGIEGHDLTMLLFSGGPEPGGFAFQIDQVRFR